jgi:putative membrane protein
MLPNYVTMGTFEKALLGAFVAITVASCVRAPFPAQMYLQHVPTAVAVVLFPLALRRGVLSTPAFACLIAFMLFHVLGARYIYSYVPYDEWAARLTGSTITDLFGFRRNHYDRVVHFAFGLLWVRPVWEVLTRQFKVPSRFALYASVEFVLAFSLVYELFEWGLTLVLSPEDAGAYNGEQGDLWDAHRDMSFALIGSIVGLVIWRIGARRGIRPAA